MMNKPDWMGQRNAWSDQMRAGNMGDPAFRQQMFAARDQWQQARGDWQNNRFPSTSGPPVAVPSQPMPQRPMGYTGGTQTGFGQNWFQQNRPALEQWFQQQMGMRPTGLFPFNPTAFGPKTTP